MPALSTVPVGRITVQARNVQFARTVLAVLAWLLFGVGWLVAKGFGLAWFAFVWCAVAVGEGWREARKGQVANESRRPG